jgi:hypothetical protein
MRSAQAGRALVTGKPDVKDAYDAYSVYSAGERKAAEKKGDFKDELLVTMGECSAPSGPKKNYWRGWRMKSEPEDEDGGVDVLGD